MLDCPTTGHLHIWPFPGIPMAQICRRCNEGASPWHGLNFQSYHLHSTSVVIAVESGTVRRTILHEPHPDRNTIYLLHVGWCAVMALLHLPLSTYKSFLTDLFFQHFSITFFLSQQSPRIFTKIISGPDVLEVNPPNGFTSLVSLLPQVIHHLVMFISP